MLSLAQRVELEIEIRKRELFAESVEKYGNSLANFVRDAWHNVEPVNKYCSGRVIDAMCEHLQAVTSGQINRLLINVPPGCMKSLLTNVFWPSWEWGVKNLAHYRYILTSYKEELSVRDNMRARRLITSDWYQDRFPHVKLLKDQNAKEKFENNLCGFRHALPLASTTGARGDRMIVDDPHSVINAESEATRDNVGFIFRAAIPTRLNTDASAIVVIMQRLHENDVSGIILSEKLGYEHLRLPMRYESATQCVTSIGFKDDRVEDGELLFPELFPAARVDQIEKSLGDVDFAGQFQQRPSPRGGNIIQKDWLNIIDIAPSQFTYVLQSVDTAYKDGEQNDYSVILTMGVLNDKIYVLDMLRGKWKYPQLLSVLTQTAARWNPHAIAIEDKASGSSLIQSAQANVTIGRKIHAIQVDKNKVARANAVTPMLESGIVYIVNGAWNADFIHEVTTFPASIHDDITDTLTQGLTFLERIMGQKLKAVTADIFAR